MQYLFRAALLISAVCYAQTAQAPATPDEVKYLRFMLLNVASLDHDPKAVKAYEEALVMQFGLNAQESASIHVLGQTLKPTLARLRQSSHAIVAGKSALSPADNAALASVTEE